MGASASAADAIALGRQAAASATSSIAVGQGAAAANANAVALGDGVSTTNTSQVNIGAKRLFVGAPTTAPASGDLIASQVSFSLNEAGNLLTITAKYSDGTTVKAGTLALI